MSQILVERPIFIVGAGRSGTTLLRSLLSAHPRMTIAPEMHFMQRVDQEEGFASDSPRDFHVFWSRFTGGARFQDLEVDAQRCLERIEHQGDRTFRGILLAVLAEYAARQGKVRVGEKTPGHVFYLEQLLEWFPEARVVVMRRDPRAVVASQLRTPWTTSKLTPRSLRGGVFIHKRLQHAASYAADWATIYEERVPKWDGDPRVLVVPYETLVGHPEKQLREICEFLEEPFEPAMLTNRSASTVHVPNAFMRDVPESWRKQHYGATLDPVSTQGLGKWKQELSRTEVATIEARCARGMRAFGYSPSRSGPGQVIMRTAAAALLTAGRLEEKARAMAARTLRPARTLLRKAHAG